MADLTADPGKGLGERLDAGKEEAVAKAARAPAVNTQKQGMLYIGIG
jgi:hypothetical protein